jgi:hypothetical protein
MAFIDIQNDVEHQKSLYLWMINPYKRLYGVSSIRRRWVCIVSLRDVGRSDTIPVEKCGCQHSSPRLKEITLQRAMNEARLLICRHMNLRPITCPGNLCNEFCNNNVNTATQLVLCIFQTLTLHSWAKCHATIPYCANTVRRIFDSQLRRRDSYFLRFYLEHSNRWSNLWPFSGCHNRDIPSSVPLPNTSFK